MKQFSPSVAIVSVLIILLLIFIVSDQLDLLQKLKQHSVLLIRVMPESTQKQIYSDKMLVITIQNDKKIYLNSVECGTLLDTNLLQTRLRETLKQRTGDVLFAVENNQHTVIIKSARTTKYHEIIKVVDAAKGAGASPIILQIDDLDQ